MTAATHRTELRHEAFVFESDDQLIGGVAPHLKEGLAEDEALIAVLTRTNQSSIREALGADAGQVLFLDSDEQYIRPARTLKAYDAVLRETAEQRGTSVRVVAEMPPSQSPAEGAEWLAYEAILNRALAHLPVSVVCLYDARVVSDSVIDGVWRTHPWSFSDGGTANPLFAHPEHAAAVLALEPLAAPGLDPIDPGDGPGAFRERLSRAMIAHGIPQAAVMTMLVAATEVATNAWQHGGGPTGARAGIVDGRFVCEISDGGPGLTDPIAGYYPPAAGRSSGRGMWVARQLTYRVDVLDAAPGTTVRLWL